MPVQLTDSPLLQMLLGTGDVMALRQILNDLFTGPAAVEQLCLTLREAPFHIGDEAVVSAWGAELIWVLQVDGLVGSS